MNQEQKDQFAAWVVEEILKHKAAWIKAVYRAILPPEMYSKAAAGKEEDRIKQWAKDAGYSWHEYTGESQLHRGGDVVARFKPELVDNLLEGGKQIQFTAEINGVPCRFEEMNSRN